MIPGAEHNKADRMVFLSSKLRRTAVDAEAEIPNYKWEILKNCAQCKKPKWIEPPGSVCSDCNKHKNTDSV
jgi:recombinational DNA repair protein RecR